MLGKALCWIYVYVVHIVFWVGAGSNAIRLGLPARPTVQAGVTHWGGGNIIKQMRLAKMLNNREVK